MRQNRQQVRSTESSSSYSRAGRLQVLALVLGLASQPVFADQTSLWVWTDEVSDPNAQSTLVDLSAANAVDVLYVSVYQAPSSSGRRMYEDADLASLITKAHDSGIEVWAAYGAPDWANFPCTPWAWPVARIDEVIAYNAANPTAPFDGVMLDVEPGAPDASLLEMYDCLGDRLAAAGVKVGAAIRFYWDAPVEFPTGGATKPLHEHIIDLDLDHVVVMGYRDYADGIIELDEDEIAYADSQGKSDMVFAGLETMAGLTDYVTFAEEGNAAMQQEAATVSDHFATSSSFAGFAIHYYRASFLAGTANWPE